MSYMMKAFLKCKKNLFINHIEIWTREKNEIVQTKALSHRHRKKEKYKLHKRVEHSTSHQIRLQMSRKLHW